MTRKRRPRPRRGKVGYVQPEHTPAAWRTFLRGESDVLFYDEGDDGETWVLTRDLEVALSLGGTVEVAGVGEAPEWARR